jgi:uncharacterized repeat protein (TIGR01451 family)
LAISKSLEGQLVVGQIGTYSLEVRNVGSVPTTSMSVLTDPLPAGLTYVSASGSGWDCSGSSAQFVICIYNDPIAPGDPPLLVTLEVSVSNAAFPSVTNNAVISTDGDVDDSNDSDDVVTGVMLTSAPAPVMSWLGLVLALSALSWITFVQLRRSSQRNR